MLSRRRSLPSLLALLILVAPLGAVPTAYAAPIAPSADDAPRLAVLLTALWNQVTGWWAPFGTITAAAGEDPPPEEQEDDDDPFGGSGDSDPGSGGGVTDPNGG